MIYVIEMSEEKISRRNYAKYAGAGIVVVAVAGVGGYYVTRPTTKAEPVTLTHLIISDWLSPYENEMIDNYSTQTGHTINVESVAWDQMFPKILTYFESGATGYDIVNVDEFR